MKRTNISTEAKWEKIVGYSRAVKIGPIIEVSGTTAVKDEKVYAPGDPYEQTRYALSLIKQSIIRCGGSLEDVIRTRMYVKDIKDWEQVARAHAEFFGDIRPATSMVEVSALIDEGLLVEIEATAYIY